MSTCSTGGINPNNTFATNLSNSQKNTIKQIVQYGTSNGYNVHLISSAIKTAYIESSFGLQLSNGIPGNTATGLFAYTDGQWADFHSSIGIKDDFANQIEALFNDLTTYHEWFYHPTLSSNIPKNEIIFGEYAYIKHHDGRSHFDYDNSPGNDKYNAVLTGGLAADIMGAEYAAYDALGLCKETYRAGAGKPVYKFPSNLGDGGLDGDTPSNDYEVEEWEPDEDRWTGTAYHQGESVDFTFFGTESQLDSWLEDEDYLDLFEDEYEDIEEL